MRNTVFYIVAVQSFFLLTAMLYFWDLTCDAPTLIWTSCFCSQWRLSLELSLVVKHTSCLAYSLFSLNLILYAVGLSNGYPEMTSPNAWNLSKLTLFGRVFGDVITLRILKWWDYPGLSRWALNAITTVLIREGHEEVLLRHQRGGGKVIRKMKAGVRRPQAKGRLEPPEADWDKGRASPRAVRGGGALQTPWLWTSDLQNYERINIQCVVICVTAALE